MEADLQRLGGDWREIKVVAYLTPPGSGEGNQAGGEQQQEASAAILRRLTMTQGASRRSTVAMPRPPGPWLVVLCRPLWRAPCPLPPPGLPGCPHSRNAGAALLTRVELGWGGQGPGGGQGGLGAQRAGQEGRRATWEGEGHTDTSEQQHPGCLFTHTLPAPTCRGHSQVQTH